jgi:hypothetical protein
VTRFAAAFDFTAVEDEGLSIAEGDVVEVLEVSMTETLFERV